LSDNAETTQAKKTRPNPSVYCDVDRLEKFKSLVSSFVNEGRFYHLVKNLLASLSGICNCRQAVIYILAN